MSVVLVDIGNSAIKLNFVSKEIAAASGSVLDDTCKSLKIGGWEEFDFKKLPKAVHYWVTSCVDKAKLHQLSDALEEAGRTRDRIRAVDHRLISLEMDVDAPEAVGVDRLVGCFAVAQRLAADEAAIVVDAGTAVTIDMVTGKGEFCGGVIYPGADAAFLQLNQQTAALPGLDYAARNEIVAAWQADAKQLAGTALNPWQRNTATAIVSGVYRVQLAGLDQTVSQFRASLPNSLASNCRIVLTGGGIQELLHAGQVLGCQPGWINEATVEPDLIHAGLLLIHHQNNRI